MCVCYICVCMTPELFHLKGAEKYITPSDFLGKMDEATEAS